MMLMYSCVNVFVNCEAHGPAFYVYQAMRKGELAAYGTPFELKSEFGSALQFTTLVASEDVVKANASIHKYFGDCINWVKVDSGEVKIEKIKQS
jgi:hypothetical protein